MTVISDILINASTAAVLIFVDALVLWLAIDKILKYSEKNSNAGFKRALKIAFIAGITGFVLSIIPLVLLPDFFEISLIKWTFFAIPLFVILILIKKNYTLDLKKSIIALFAVILGEGIAGFAIGRIILGVIS